MVSAEVSTNHSNLTDASFTHFWVSLVFTKTEWFELTEALQKNKTEKEISNLSKFYSKFSEIEFTHFRVPWFVTESEKSEVKWFILACKQTFSRLTPNWQTIHLTVDCVAIFNDLVHTLNKIVTPFRCPRLIANPGVGLQLNRRTWLCFILKRETCVNKLNLTWQRQRRPSRGRTMNVNQNSDVLLICWRGFFAFSHNPRHFCSVLRIALFLRRYCDKAELFNDAIIKQNKTRLCTSEWQSFCAFIVAIYAWFNAFFFCRLSFISRWRKAV